MYHRICETDTCREMRLPRPNIRGEYRIAQVAVTRASKWQLRAELAGVDFSLPTSTMSTKKEEQGQGSKPYQPDIIIIRPTYLRPAREHKAFRLAAPLWGARAEWELK